LPIVKNLASWQKRKYLLHCLWSFLILPLSLTPGDRLQAQTIPPPSVEDLDLELFDLKTPPKPGVIISNKIPQTEINPQIPTFWGVEDRLDLNLLSGWLVYWSAARKRVDFILDRQAWERLNYMERYGLVNQFGSLARDYGYDSRFFNCRQQLNPALSSLAFACQEEQEANFIATYTCNFSISPAPPNCEIKIEISSQDGVILP